jgi:hypothetical protein
MCKLKGLIWALVLLGALGLYYLTGSGVSDKPKPEYSPSQSLQYAPQQKDALQLWLDKLEKYECKDCPVGFSRIDSNGLRSYGCLQFQKETFLINLKKFYPEIYSHLEGDEWQNFIYSCEFQKELAYKMIQNNYYNWQHWKYTILVRGLEKPPKLPELPESHQTH